MTGLNGLNPSPGALILGLVQARVPVIAEPSDLLSTAERLAGLVRGAKHAMPSPGSPATSASPSATARVTPSWR